MTTAVDIRDGQWIRMNHWPDGMWRYVLAARHVPFSESEPRTTGLVHLDLSDSAGGPSTFGGFAAHDEPCLVVTVTPEAVTA